MNEDFPFVVEGRTEQRPAQIFLIFALGITLGVLLGSSMQKSCMQASRAVLSSVQVPCESESQLK